MLKTTNAMPQKNKNDGFSGCVPRMPERMESPPQSVIAMKEMMDIENITKASVISRTAVADRSKEKKRFDLLKDTPRNVMSQKCRRKNSFLYESKS